MPLIQPFRALRPAPGRAAEILAPPYDVLSSAEARERAKGKPWSFLHISKPEIDLDPATDPYDKAVYAKAAENLATMIAAGVLIRDPKPCYYVYRLTWRGRTQTGLAAAASLADYASNRIRKHELTTPVKEDDRVRQIEASQRADRPGDDRLSGLRRRSTRMLAQAAAGKPEVDVTADDDVRHQLWVIADDATIGKLSARLRRSARNLHRRRPSPLGGGRARRRRHVKAKARTSYFPVGDLPRTRDDHPRLQSRD